MLVFFGVGNDMPKYHLDTLLDITRKINLIIFFLQKLEK